MIVTFVFAGLLLSRCGKHDPEQLLADTILENQRYARVRQMALETVRSGFQAGDSYGEVWIRDFNTFIKLSAEVLPADSIRQKLLVFFRLQGPDGNIVDGFIPTQKAAAGYDYIYSDLETRFAGHKNTVETDQESSLVQAVFKYIQSTGDSSILSEVVGDKSVSQRLAWAMEYLMHDRYDSTYGLLYGATTADWGDVQPEHEWGVFLTEDTHPAIDVYDNAMFVIALNNLCEMLPATRTRWTPVRDSIMSRTMRHLWDGQKRKFRPHIYLNGSPFPPDFNEDEIYYHGGTAVAIEAGLLDRDDIARSLNMMIDNVRKSGAGSIGLTLYPTYPSGYFVNKGMYPYGYQNGGDWDWFGGRMIQQLVRYGFIREAVEQLEPMIRRADENQGFYEWYTVDNKPEGSGTFRGSAGVLYEAIVMLESWAGMRKQAPAR